MLFSGAGCMSWDEGWKAGVQAPGKVDVKGMMAAAIALENSADSGENVKKVIAAYEKVAAVDPSNFEALSKIGEYSFLYGHAYAANREEGDQYYLKSITWCEKAMYTNPEFKKYVDQGKTLWEAADALTARELAPMYWWYDSVGLYWNDLNAFSRLLNFSWPKRSNIILKRMRTIQPDWHQGRIHMAWGIYYCVLPGLLGGDVNKAEENFTRAVQLGPDALVNFYNRAKYLQVKKGDREAFKKDLEYVLSKNPRNSNYSYHWTVAYQKMAKELLAETDRLF